MATLTATDTQNILFLNCTQHYLTQEQFKRIKEKYSNIQIKDIKEFSIFKDIKNSASIYDFLELQVYDLLDFLKELLNKYNKIYLHLPIGSSAFMWFLSKEFYKDSVLKQRVIPIFSHTERQVVEEINDNNEVVKKSVFKFIDFIEF